MEFFEQIGSFFAWLVQNQTFIQIFGFIGTACVLLGMQCKAYEKLLFTKFSNPVLLPGKPHGQRSLVGCSPWGC